MATNTSSERPSSGMRSGTRSMGDATYARAAPAKTLLRAGTRESRINRPSNLTRLGRASAPSCTLLRVSGHRRPSGPMTASGRSGSATSQLRGGQSRSNDPGVLAETGSQERRRPPKLRTFQRSHDRVTSRLEEDVAGPRRSPTDHDHLRIEQRHEARQADAEPHPHLRHGLSGLWVALGGSLGQMRSGGGGAKRQTGGEPGRRRGGG